MELPLCASQYPDPIDKPATERLDYFSAGLSILFGLYVAVMRLFHLYPRSSKNDNHTPTLQATHARAISRHAWTLMCTCLYISHIMYLSLGERFDYGYNILANVVIGFTHNLLWVLYSIPRTPFKRFPYSSVSSGPSSRLQAGHSKPKRWMSKPLKCVALMTAATMLELFDFPPWYRVIDAHALWHVATAPIASMWYDFLVEDSRDEGWVLHKLQ